MNIGISWLERCSFDLIVTNEKERTEILESSNKIFFVNFNESGSDKSELIHFKIPKDNMQNITKLIISAKI